MLKICNKPVRLQPNDLKLLKMGYFYSINTLIYLVCRLLTLPNCLPDDYTIIPQFIGKYRSVMQLKVSLGKKITDSVIKFN